ncbi:MAG: hypothetical protein WD669_11475 [Pirellulales bacterium]
MRFFFVSVGLAIALLQIPSAACGQDDAVQAARAAARRALEMANLELRLYLQVEHPREMRHLDAQIKLAEAEVKAYEERRREYEPFNKFSTGRPLLLPMQSLRLCLLEAELRLDDLRAERNALVRFHSDRWRLLELRALDARAHVVELEGGGQIAVPAAAVARQ